MRASRITPWLLVATLTAAGAAAAAGYGLTAPKRYRATAAILLSPISADDPTFAGLGLLRDASGRRTAAASAAALVTTPQVADAVRAQLGLRRSSASLLHDVHADVAPESDVVRVTGEDSTGVGAAQLANAFVDALIAQRTASFQSQLASAVSRDEQLLAGSKDAEAGELARRLAVLRSFQGQPDPTLRRVSTATAPA
jgi:capsular polysaccharide biosynthesis protein